MTRYSSYRFLLPIFLSLFLFLGLSASQQPGNAVNNPPKIASSKKPGFTASANPRTVDLDNAISFSLSNDEKNQLSVEFQPVDSKPRLLGTGKDDSVEAVLASQFAQEPRPDGVLIRVAKNVKYQTLEDFYKSVKTAMVDQKIAKPIYISVQEKQQEKQTQEEERTQEFVIKHMKAADIYDRVNTVARVLKISVRLDPSRNSITAKGPGNKVQAIQNLVNYIDKPAAGSNTPPKRNTGTPNPGKSLPPKKPSFNGEKKEQKTNDRKPPYEGPRQEDSKLPQMDLAKEGLLSGNKVGRYQLTGVGSNLFLLDTSTGESWFLDTSGNSMNWIKMPHPKGNR